MALLFSSRAHPSFCRLPFPPLPATADNYHIYGAHLFVSARHAHRFENSRLVSSRISKRVILENLQLPEFTRRTIFKRGYTVEDEYKDDE